MAGRITFAAIALFWVVMNVLLVRGDLGSGRETVSEVPLDTVWQRVLTAPDNSTLDLRHHGVHLGTVRWIPTILESTPTNTQDRVVHELAGDGMVNSLAGYRLDIDAAINGEEPATRFRLRGQLELSAARLWREWSLRIDRRPQAWTVSMKNNDKFFHLGIDDGRRHTDQDLPIPRGESAGAMLGQYAGFLPPGVDTKSLTGTPGQPPTADPIKWVARQDWLKIGKSRAQVYKVTATVMDKFQGTAYISRAGEILKVQLPDGLVLSSEALSAVKTD